MVTNGDPPPLSDLHMLVLGRIAYLASEDVDDLADWLGLRQAAVERLCADLEAARLLTRARGQ